MMGQAVGQQDRLFYEFNLDERIPVNHLLRRIDAVLDLSWLRAELSPFYSHTGCPSIDPELMSGRSWSAIAIRSARSAGCARRSNLIWPIAGFAA